MNSSTGATLSGSYTGASSAPTAVGFKYGTTSGNLTQTVQATDNSGSLSATLSGLSVGTKYFYKAFATVSGTESHASESQTFYGDELNFTTKKVATATVTTVEATDVTSSSATLHASFAGASGTVYDRGFRYRKGNGNWVTPDGLGSTSLASADFSMEIGSLSENSTYTFQAYVTEWDEEQNAYVDRWASNTLSFTTPAAQQQQVDGWLELPAATTGSNYFNGYFGTGTSRNYSYHYDKSKYTALWVAYPLTKSHTTGSASGTSWNFNPQFSDTYQIDVTSNSYGTNYGNSTYSRGHQLPAADRKCSSEMRSQTYYVTNQTPQDQNGFNSPMWSNLEDAVRGLTAQNDTVYVVTGAAFQKAGTTETISYLHAAKTDVIPSAVPIPNYYWKVILRVKRVGGTITGAKAIGIWMKHQAYSSATAWQSAIYSVDQIETWTGFDFFHNLPDEIESVAESVSSWLEFSSTISNTISPTTDNDWGSF